MLMISRKGCAVALAGALLVSAVPAFAAKGGEEAAGQLGSVLKRAQQVHDLQMTDEDEQKIGAAVSERIRQRYGVVQDPPVHKYVTLVGAVLAQASERPNLPWKFIVLDTDGVNALAAPGGYVHITRGALSLMKNEAELAGVLGHEIIHVTEKHTIRAIQKGKAIQMGTSETLSNSPALFNKFVDKATEGVMAGFGRGEELEADDKGVLLANKVGYAPSGLSTFLTTIKERNSQSSEKQGLFASHPEMDERLKKLEKKIADAKLAATALVDARFQKNITYKPVPLGAVTTVEKGSAGLTGGGTAKGDDKTEAKTEATTEAKKDDQASGDDGKKKKRGFGLSKLISPSSGGEQKSAENTGSAAAKGLDKERLAKGGPNPAAVVVSVTAADLTAFKKEANLN
jgi:Zn-dependent protease with chaperone function